MNVALYEPRTDAEYVSILESLGFTTEKANALLELLEACEPEEQRV